MNAGGGEKMEEKVRTVWMRIHKDKRIILKVTDGKIVRKDGKLRIRDPTVIVTVGSGKDSVHFGLTPEEVSNLRDILAVLSEEITRQKIDLQQKFDELRQEEKAKGSRPAETVVVATAGTFAKTAVTGVAG